VDLDAGAGMCASNIKRNDRGGGNALSKVIPNCTCESDGGQTGTARMSI